MNQPLEPWKIETNGKYCEVIKSLFGLSTAALLMPVFFARNFLSIGDETPLTEIFTSSLYFSWLAFGLSIISCLFFQYVSAKWTRKAWGKDAGLFFSKDTHVQRLEACLDLSFWVSALSFIIGLLLVIIFFLTFDGGT